MIRRLRATTFVKRLSTGRNQPCVMLCEDDDGEQETVVVKLRAAFDAKLKAVSDAGYILRIDDGVLLNLCPLWELVPSWQEELQASLG